MQDYLPITYTLTGGAMVFGYGRVGVQTTYSVGKAAVIATGQSAYWLGTRTKELVERTGAEFCVAPIETETGGAIGVGVRWSFW